MLDTSPWNEACIFDFLYFFFFSPLCRSFEYPPSPRRFFFVERLGVFATGVIVFDPSPCVPTTAPPLRVLPPFNTPGRRRNRPFPVKDRSVLLPPPSLLARCSSSRRVLRVTWSPPRLWRSWPLTPPLFFCPARAGVVTSSFGGSDQKGLLPLPP